MNAIHRRTIESVTLSTVGLILVGLLLAATPAPSEAGVRVRIKAPRPAARVVVVKPAPRVVVSAPRPAVVVREVVVLDAHDRAIARRIAYRTSASVAEVSALRAKGWSWTRIANHLDLDARVVAACVF